MKKIILVLTLLVGIGVSLIGVTVWLEGILSLDSFTVGYVRFQIVIGLFVFGVLWLKKGWYTYTNTAASILTIIGVFGTFLGIFIGLQAFNDANIETSIPPLLEGLKLAFLTSLVGILWAIILKGCAFAYQMIKGKNPSEEAITQLFRSQTADLLQSLTELLRAQTEDSAQVRETLSSIKTALTDNKQSTVFTQLCNLTTTVSDKHAKLIRAQADEGRETRAKLTSIETSSTRNQEAISVQLQALTETVSKNVGEIAAKVGQIATGQLIEALREVIKDFNQNLNEQFGENFKQLNEAVQKTVAWQEQYRQQMDKLAAEFQVAADSIELSRESLENISESSNTIADRSRSIAACAEKMEPILHTLNDQLEAFSGLRQKAQEAFPLIEQNLVDLTEGFSATVDKAINDSDESMETQRQALANQSQQLQNTVASTTQKLTEVTARFSDTVATSITQAQGSMAKQREALTNQSQQLETVTKALDKQLRRTLGRISSELDSVFAESAVHIAQVTTDFTQNLTRQMEAFLKAQSQSFGAIVEKNGEDMINHVNQLNRDLREELARSLSTLAGHFESLSNGFVGNYAELTKHYTQAIAELQESVGASRRIR